MLNVLLALSLTDQTNRQPSLTFSTNGAVLEGCDPFPDPVGIIYAKNQTDSVIQVQWKVIQTSFSTSGNIALIIDPFQFSPNAPGGYAWINGKDSTVIIFLIWPDQMMPGDTAIFQINVFDTADRLNTTRLLTALLVCPMTTGRQDDQPIPFLSIFPNPIQSMTYLNVS